ncbi:MAG: hypothetical protein JXN62_13310 [Bacteroidales bacterium]|nr:hypothetical protein [Bacteroidales bacterium]
MPTNLNALIRYKTINDCLSTGRKYTIEELMEACSEALGEYRGKYTGVSERTLRDDLRVMRSEILGINAPIVQEQGKYFYSDRGFHLNSVLFSDEGLIKKTIKLLKKLLVSSPDREIENLVLQLERVGKGKTAGKYISGDDYFEDMLEQGIPGLQHCITFDSFRAPGKPKVTPAAPTWGDLFRVVLKGAKR